ncbi:AAA family ATPase [candidate division KSB1 bacterium]|nr:AAA family ATPase [candidate division KSB1 bacterium]
MLKKITLHNFKSFRDSSIEFAPLTLLLGANASGKSNFVDALRFLQGCARNLTLNEVFSGKWEGGQQVWLPIRGGEHEVFNLFEKTKNFVIEVHCELTDSGIKHAGIYQLEVGLLNEVLAIRQQRLNFEEKEYIFSSPVSAESAVYDAAMLGFLHVINDPMARQRVRRWASVLKEWVSNFHFFDLAPSLMRDYVSKKRPEIGMRGENLSAVLFKLVSNPEQLQTVLGWVQELCPQEIVDFDFIETKLGDVLLAVKEPNGVTISARSMSDGTLRFLAIIAAMLTSKEGTTFIIEEIDNDLHPSRLHLLVSFLEQVTASRKLQVIASTHSPYFLDHLSEDSLKNVLVFHRDQQSAETKVTKLVDIPGFSEARKNIPLDLMHASSWMEQNL